MSLRTITIGCSIVLVLLMLEGSRSFPGEVYRWTDEKGTVHFTDDRSKIPKQYLNQVEEREVSDETPKEDGGDSKPKEKEGTDRVKRYLESIDKKIEAKKKLEKRISELEEKLGRSEELLKRIEEYEKADFSYYQPYVDKRTGKWVPVASPYFAEKRRLKEEIDQMHRELKDLQERVSEINRGM